MPWTCPTCERTLRSPNAWHDCVKVDIDSLFAGKKAELIFLFDKLLIELVEWPGVEISATRNCIVCIRKQTFLVIRPMKKELNLKFYLGEKHEDYPVSKITDLGNKWESHIRIREEKDLTTEVYRLLRKSYDLF